MTDLVNQPSPAPTRKLQAVGIAGAITAGIIAGVNAYWPGIGDQFSPAIGAAVATLVSVIAGYFTRNRA